MTRRFKPFLVPVLSLLLTIAAAPLLHAQITNIIKAHVSHTFIVGNTTLPPGNYTFRMLPGSDMTIMTATNAKGDTSVEFLVREATDSHTPKHSELVFNRYGNTEILTKIFQAGSKIGVAVIEPSRAELRLQHQGQHPVEHTEEQTD